ncbi:MAG: gliding motility-associated C-terminal domain-containing protein [Chitinophagaceae bacterium]|nr:gliding motility-associated C-terminal domain-containing protein [Chitinophagaceae bacterium]
MLLLLYVQYLYAQQKEANVWYFGRFLGLDFNSGAAVPLNNGQLNTTEGVATISDVNGNLLFYTEGTTIWNRLHQVMPNGTGLFGSFTSTQSAIIVPKIGDTTRYYVFTVDAQAGPRGLTYSVVNMTLDGGRGDVEIKNVTLQLNVVEKITAVKHCNNRDIWVLTHGTVSNTYYSFLVSPTGINTTPVISNTGVTLPAGDSATLGYLKASPDGKRIAAAHLNVNTDVSDFNNATGVVSNSLSLFLASENHYKPYGVEFSPDSKLVYTTIFYVDPANAQKRNALLQYDVTLGTPAAISASKQVISQNSDPIQTYAALQIAPDGKMYMAKNTYKHIASIDNPNVYGSGCNFVTNAIQYTLPNQASSFGLPTFIQSYFYPVDSFTHVVNCPGLSVNFNYTLQPNTTSVLWDFGDPASGANNSSTQINPVHVFSAPGLYTVQLIKFTNCGQDTIRRQVSTSSININLGPDTLVCGGTSVLLNSSAAGSTNTFVWQDGSTNPTFLATIAGLYWVQATNSMGCTSRDSINVIFKPIPVYNLGADTAICENNILTLNATVAGATSYLWSTGAGTAIINTGLAGIYWCDVNKEGCIFRDSLSLTVNLRPVVNLGNDISVCGNNPVILNAANPNSTYLWQDGSTNATYTAATSGLYWVEVRNSSGCIKRDSINIAFNSLPVFNLGPDKDICQGDTVTLNAAVTGATGYLWNTGATTPTITAYQAGLYWCEVNNGCIFRDSMTITAVIPRPVVNLGNDIAVCGNNPITLDATNPNCTYLWQDGSTNATYIATISGLYWVEVKNSSGCTKRDSINIAFNTVPVFNLGTDTPVCQGDTLTLNAAIPGAISYLWNTGATTPTIKTYQAGLYWCEVNNGCIFRDSIIITAVVSKPVVNLGSDISICGNSPVTLDATNPNCTYLWQDGSANATYTAAISGLYWVEVRNSNGCTKRDSIKITFTPFPVFNLGVDKDICQGDTVTLNAAAAGAISYLWNNGATTPAIKAYQAGLYWCEVNNGCLFRDSMFITAVKPLPVVNLGNDVAVCEGANVSLDAAYPNATYLWQDGSTNPVFNATLPGLYSVEVNLNGCKRSDTIRITHNLKPRFTLGPDQVVCPGSPLVLNPAINNGWQLAWQDGSANSSYTITLPGSYSLTATNNCGSTTDDIIVSKGVCKVFIPTAFTPNNDGRNDLFKALGTETVTKFDMKVFNRWGEIVFQTTDKSKGWDGKLGGVDQSSAVYIYTMQYTDINSSQPQVLKGTFVLIR